MYPSSYHLWIRQGRTDLVSPNDFEVWREREFPDVSLDFADPQEDDAQVTARPN
jgi:hypothetical protein